MATGGDSDYQQLTWRHRLAPWARETVMLLTEVEIQESDQQAEEFDRSAGRRAMLARGERTSCLRTGGSMSVICVGDTELAEHSDEEWYPPTPPLYDVTDKLR